MDGLGGLDDPADAVSDDAYEIDPLSNDPTALA